MISAITVGATGYLLKDAFPTDIATTVRDLVAGHSPISASIARFIVRRTQGTAQISAEPAPGLVLNTAKAHPARDRHPLGHRQGLQLRRDREPSRPVQADRARPHQEHLSQARGAHPRRGGVRGGAAGPDQAVSGREPCRGEGTHARAAPALLSRLVPYLLLQALIVIATILGLRLLQPSDPDDFAVSEFLLREDGATRPVTLPHFTSSRYSLADPPLYTGTFIFKPDAANIGLVGVSAALQQWRGGRGQRRRDPGLPARSHRQPARPQHAGDRGDPVVAAARRQQRHHRAAVGVGSAAGLPRHRLCRAGRKPAGSLRDAHAAVRDAARGVLGLAVAAGGDPRHHVADAAARAGLWRAGGGNAGRRDAGLRAGAAAARAYPRLAAILLASAPIEEARWW